MAIILAGFGQSFQYQLNRNANVCENKSWLGQAAADSIFQ